MTGPAGNSEFCFPETINVSRGASHQVFCYTSQPKSRKNCEEIVCFTTAGSKICRGVKKHDLITCESKVYVVVSLDS